MESIIGYAYEVGAYEVNLYKVIEINGKISFKIIEWHDFNIKENIDQYIKLLEEQGYKNKEFYINNNNFKELIKKKEG